MLNDFLRKGGASFLLGGQWGSEGKGAAAAFVATHLNNVDKGFDIVTTNAGAQAGHTSTHKGVTKVVFHLPTVSLYRPCTTYLNAGSIINPDGLRDELRGNPQVHQATTNKDET
jgi:adenylosuccinate synthase